MAGYISKGRESNLKGLYNDLPWYDYSSVLTKGMRNRELSSDDKIVSGVQRRVGKL
jgi:hypothetical protein